MKAVDTFQRCSECWLLPMARQNDSGKPYLACHDHGAERLEAVPVSTVSEARRAFDQAKVLGHLAGAA